MQCLETYPTARCGISSVVLLFGTLDFHTMQNTDLSGWHSNCLVNQVDIFTIVFYDSSLNKNNWVWFCVYKGYYVKSLYLRVCLGIEKLKDKVSCLIIQKSKFKHCLKVKQTLYTLNDIALTSCALVAFGPQSPFIDPINTEEKKTRVKKKTLVVWRSLFRFPSVFTLQCKINH